MRVRRAALALMTVGAIALSGCTVSEESTESKDSTGSSASSDGPIVLGLAISRSGWMAAYDVPAEQAAQLAVDDYNAKGGVAGRKFETKVVDTQTDQQIAATAAQQLIADGAEIILASSDFDYGSPTALAAQADGVVTISLGAASPSFGTLGIGDLAFTLGTPTPTLAAAGAEWAYGKGWTKAAALCDISVEYSSSLCDYFEESFTDAGGTVVAKENFQQEDASIAQQVNQLQKADADFIYLGSYLPGGASAVRQIRAAGVDLPIVSGAAMEGTEWLASVPNLADFYFTPARFIHGPGENEEVTNFLAEYREKFGKNPEHSDALVGYAAIQVLAAALEHNGGDTSGAALAKALNELKDVDTVLGPITFSEGTNLALEREMAVVEVSDGQLRLVDHVTPKNVPTPES